MILKYLHAFTATTSCQSYTATFLALLPSSSFLQTYPFTRTPQRSLPRTRTCPICTALHFALAFLRVFFFYFSHRSSSFIDSRCFPCALPLEKLSVCADRTCRLWVPTKSASTSVKVNSSTATATPTRRAQICQGTKPLSGKTQRRIPRTQAAGQTFLKL